MKRTLIVTRFWLGALLIAGATASAADWDVDSVRFEHEAPIVDENSKVFTFPISRALGNDVLKPKSRYLCRDYWSRNRTPSWFDGFLIAEN